MSVIGLFLLFAVLVAVVVVPVATIAAVRAVGRAFNIMGTGAPPVNDAVDARLTRIEEAIDAMALQIDRIARERRTLPATDPRETEIDPGTREDS